MCDLMADVIAGKTTPIVANAVCNAGGKLLKVVEMEHKFGAPSKQQNDKVLHLAG